VEEKIVKLIDDGKYLGSKGAISLARKALKAEKNSSSTKKISVMMDYINVLYSAMAAFAKGAVVKKVYALYLAVLVSYWAHKVETHRSELALKYIIGAGGCHVLMSVWARDLQILKFLRVLPLSPALKRNLSVRMVNAYNLIGELANEESRHYESKNNADISPASRLQLLGASLLYELGNEGLYTYYIPGSSEKIRHRIEWYCEVWQNLGLRERSEVQLVCRLWRAIGRHERAEDIARRYGTKDQFNKAKMA
jgi:hypothetical protein